MPQGCRHGAIWNYLCKELLERPNWACDQPKRVVRQGAEVR
jgi:hypothetical protein